MALVREGRPYLPASRQEGDDIRWLRELGMVRGARVGSTLKPWQDGTIVMVSGRLSIGVRWDDDTYELVPWTRIAGL